MSPAKRTSSRSGLWQNNWLVSLVVLLAVINLLLMLYCVFTIKPVAKPVPVKYTSFTNFETLGLWQNLYTLPIMSWLVSGLNVYLAQGVYRRSRITSVVLILASMIFALLAAQTTLFFLGVSYGAN